MSFLIFAIVFGIILFFGGIFGAAIVSGTIVAIFSLSLIRILLLKEKPKWIALTIGITFLAVVNFLIAFIYGAMSTLSPLHLLTLKPTIHSFLLGLGWSAWNSVLFAAFVLLQSRELLEGQLKRKLLDD